MQFYSLCWGKISAGNKTLCQNTWICLLLTFCCHYSTCCTCEPKKLLSKEQSDLIAKKISPYSSISWHKTHFSFSCKLGSFNVSTFRGQGWLMFSVYGALCRLCLQIWVAEMGHVCRAAENKSAVACLYNEKCEGTPLTCIDFFPPHSNPQVTKSFPFFMRTCCQFSLPPTRQTKDHLSREPLNNWNKNKD